MSLQILTTKLYIPATRSEIVSRPHLIKRLNHGLRTRLTLVCAPAGFGKTTIISEWLSQCDYPSTWLSLDEQDNDPVRFLMYVIAALQTIEPRIGDDILQTLQSPQPPAIDTLLIPLINAVAKTLETFILVLDDYHVIESQEIDTAFSFLLENLPPQMHIVITTREDPQLPLARLRARGYLTELRAKDLRFTADESSAFLNRSLDLQLSQDHIAILGRRTEGWIAGLQLAALSMHGRDDIEQFIQNFAGDHRYIVDYLVEEVLQHQPTRIQDFLLQTSILERLTPALCAAVTNQDNVENLLEELERANLFVIHLDDERQWYRYHHLFADVLQTRLIKEHPERIPVLHRRASEWYEANSYELEAFQHAAAGHHVERAINIIQTANVPLYFRGFAYPILAWLKSLSDEVLNATPSLWVMYGWGLMISYQNIEVEQKLLAAEIAMGKSNIDAHIAGQIAAIRAMLAANQYQTSIIIEQSQLALELLDASSLYLRSVILRTLAIAYQYQGERVLAEETYREAIEASEKSDNLFINILATTGLGIVQLSNNQLRQAEQTFRHVLELVGEPPGPIACAAYLRLGRIYYEWNNISRAEQYTLIGIELARQIDTVDSATSGEIFLAKLKLNQGQLSDASERIAQIEQVVRQRKFDQQMPPLIEMKVRLCLQQGDLAGAERLATTHDATLSQARVYLAQNKPQKALDILTSHQLTEEQDWIDEHLSVMVLQALAYQMANQIDEALQTLQDILRRTRSDGFTRLFVDEGEPMQALLSELARQGFMPDYTQKLLDAFDTTLASTQVSANQALIEPLSDREIEILQLVADGLSNREISDRLYLALSTVKGHNRNIYGKLGVSRRTEAVALARELGLLQD